jgi:hypothetical protein
MTLMVRRPARSEANETKDEEDIGGTGEFTLRMKFDEGLPIPAKYF